MISLFTILIFLLSACSGDDADELNEQRYSGESDQWEAKLHVKEHMEFELVYKEDNPGLENDISFIVEIGERSFGGSDFRLNNDGFLNMHIDWIPTDLESDMIEVIVEWEEHKETIQLKEE